MHVDVAALVAAYGYPIVFFGSMLEGETVLTLAGLATHRGHLSFVPVWLLAAAGGAIGDVTYFVLGRRYGSAILARFPSLAPAAERVRGLILRGPAFAVVSVRFLYGVRIAGPVVIGSSALPWTTFVFWNLLGSLLWSACWLTAGYLLGEAAQRLVGDLAHAERELFAGVLILALVIALVIRVRARRLR